MKLPLLNIDGTKSSSIEISDKLINLKVNHKLIKFVIDWQLNHSKPRVAKTKQRKQIKGSTKKIIAQKGSGGARHASKKAPIFVGGGIAHGPKGDNYKIKKINQKLTNLILLVLLLLRLGLFRCHQLQILPCLHHEYYPQLECGEQRGLYPQSFLVR